MKRVFLISMVCVSLSSCTYEEVVNYLKTNENISNTDNLSEVNSTAKVDKENIRPPR